MQHRGEIVEQAVRQSGYSLTKLTQRLGKSRRWIYHAFENPILSIEVILEIGKIIHHDFSDEIIDLKRYSAKIAEPLTSSLKNSENSVISQNDYWKNKYLLLLEKYNALLEKRTNE
jgi:predicted transcriptional regulator